MPAQFASPFCQAVAGQLGNCSSAWLRCCWCCGSFPVSERCSSRAAMRKNTGQYCCYHWPPSSSLSRLPVPDIILLTPLSSGTEDRSWVPQLRRGSAQSLVRAGVGLIRYLQAPPTHQWSRVSPAQRSLVPATS